MHSALLRMAPDRAVRSVCCSCGERGRAAALGRAIDGAGMQVEEKLAAAQRQAAAESGARGHSLMMADEVVPLASLGGYYRFASSRRFGGAVKVCRPPPLRTAPLRLHRPVQHSC